jgi:hypothetical protein
LARLGLTLQARQTLQIHVIWMNQGHPKGLASTDGLGLTLQARQILQVQAVWMSQGMWQRYQGMLQTPL